MRRFSRCAASLCGSRELGHLLSPGLLRDSLVFLDEAVRVALDPILGEVGGSFR